jgi:Mg/Co/Ni transporter MgtE
MDEDIINKVKEKIDGKISKDIQEEKIKRIIKEKEIIEMKNIISELKDKVKQE